MTLPDHPVLGAVLRLMLAFVLEALADFWSWRRSYRTGEPHDDEPPKAGRARFARSEIASRLKPALSARALERLATFDDCHPAARAGRGAAVLLTAPAWSCRNARNATAPLCSMSRAHTRV